ncbi:hypothetical protein V6N12_076135 [Hibiscus sabdariffa]|uniref:Uncharacterized protein n=1 Tax=Hibiscus sabdariffa TaxID=183260 RepID=A0ABR2AYC3_9ROSI
MVCSHEKIVSLTLVLYLTYSSLRRKQAQGIILSVLISKPGAIKEMNLNGSSLASVSCPIFSSRSLQRDSVTAAADKAKRLAGDSRTEDEGGKSFSILRSDFVCLKSSTIGLFPHSSFWASTSVLGTLIKRSREAHRSCFQPVLPGKTSLTHTISSPPSRLAIPNVAFLTSEGFSPSVQPDSISGNEEFSLEQPLAGINRLIDCDEALNKEKEEEEAVIWKEEEEFLRIRNNRIPDFTLESWALGCEAAHSAFAGTKSAASLFAIGAVLAFVSEALLAQVDSELMVSCNVKKEEEGKSPEGRTNTVVVRIRGQLTSFLEDAPELGVLLLDFSLPTRGVDLVVHDERHSIERRERPGKIRVEIDPRPGEVVVSGHKGFTRDYRPAKGKAHRSSFKRDKTRKAETPFVLHSPETRGVWDLRTLTDGTQLTGLRGGDGIPIPTERRHEPLLIIERGGDRSLIRVRTALYHKPISVESPGQELLRLKQVACFLYRKPKAPLPLPRPGNHKPTLLESSEELFLHLLTLELHANTMASVRSKRHHISKGLGAGE